LDAVAGEDPNPAVVGALEVLSGRRSPDAGLDSASNFPDLGEHFLPDLGAEVGRLRLLLEIVAADG
jgi:hypothetical protein